MSTLVPCIIAGGAGTRLWPVSREAMPKPFMCLPDGESLLQKTFSRAIGLRDVDRLLTVTNRDVFFRTLDDYRPLNASGVELDFILEPFGRNTAPAIAAAALHVARRYGEDAQLLVLPADHLITDIAAFGRAVDSARHLADQGWLVTFGILPTRAETGFGYIEKGQTLGSDGFKVERFVEKPDARTARDYLEGGLHVWNSGMFCMRVDSVLREFQTHAPHILATVINCLEHSQVFQGKQQRHLELDSQNFALPGTRYLHRLRVDGALAKSRRSALPAGLERYRFMAGSARVKSRRCQWQPVQWPERAARCAQLLHRFAQAPGGRGRSK